MKNRPIHENLDTSFVNLSALVRYLRRRQFVGNVRVELSGYEADIVLAGENELRVREHDRIAGRIAEGEEALQRLLIRAREPGGIINVYQSAAVSEKNETEIITEIKTETKNEVNRELKSEIKHTAPPPKTEILPPPAPSIPPPAPPKKIEVAEKPPLKPFANIKLPKPPVPAPQVSPAPSAAPKIAASATASESEAKPKLPDFPFDLSNNFESKAKQAQISASEWQTLLSVTNELLYAVDQTLAADKLDFTAAFQKSCVEISGDYPFLSPRAEIFAYRSGKIETQKQINAKIFVVGICEALRRIFEKLGANPKFAETHRRAVQKLLALFHQRKSLYDRFSFTAPLEKMLGTN